MKPLHAVLAAAVAALPLSQARAWDPQDHPTRTLIPATQLNADGNAGPDVQVRVPRVHLRPDQGLQQLSVTSALPYVEAPHLGEGPRLEAMASSLVPTSLTASSRIGGATNFNGLVVPAVGLTFMTSPIWEVRTVRISLMAGLGLQVLSRSGTFAADVAAPQQTVTEDMDVIPLRIGAAAQMELSRLFSLYGNLALVPTVGFTTESSFDDGQTVFGAPLELQLGVANDLRWLSQGLAHMQLRAGLDGQVSALTSANFTGAGLEAGMSFEF